LEIVIILDIASGVTFNIVAVEQITDDVPSGKLSHTEFAVFKLNPAQPKQNKQKHINTKIFKFRIKTPKDDD